MEALITGAIPVVKQLHAVFGANPRDWPHLAAAAIALRL